MSIIKNKEDLMSNASSPKDKKARRIALDAIEEAFKEADPKRIVLSKVKLEGQTLKINSDHFDLSEYKRIFVLGGGKASGTMAEALEEILKDRINDGIMVVPKGVAKNYHLDRIRLHESNHPIPDESSVSGARVMDLAMCKN